MEFDFDLAWQILPGLLKGAGVTLGLIVPTLVLGMAISIPITLVRLSRHRVASRLAWAFTAFFRGAPALILIYMVYNGLAVVGWVRDTVLWNIFSSPYNCAVIGLTLNHAGFLTEVLRGAFQAVPHGLLDAARSLALSKRQIFFKVTLPIGIRLGLSAYMNEVVLFAKGTAAVSAITVVDVLGKATETISTHYDPFTPLVMAAVIYWLIVQAIMFAFRRTEAHLNRHVDLKI